MVYTRKAKKKKGSLTDKYLFADCLNSEEHFELYRDIIKTVAKFIHAVKQDQEHDNKFCCLFCDKKCKKKSSFLDHVINSHLSQVLNFGDVTHPAPRDQRPDSCQNGTLGTNDSTQITNYSDSQGLHVCNPCGAQFSEQQKLELHLCASHESYTQSYLCQMCTKAFRFRYSLRKHVLRSHVRKISVSPPADIRSWLKNQQILHCEKCLCVFQNSQCFEYHLDVAHAEEENEKSLEKCRVCKADHVLLFHDQNLACETCGKSFLLQTELTRHIAAHNLAYTFKCPVCSRVFKARSGLRVHMQSHSDDQVQCKVCKKIFKNRSSLKSHHRNAHTNKPRPYKCEICSRMFRSVPSLKSHVSNIHLKVKSYICDKCGKAFYDSTQLNYHIRQRHTDERPFECNICGRGFVSTGMLNNHKRNVHGEGQQGESLLCQVCGLSFKSRRYLREHQIRRDHIEYSANNGENSKQFLCNVCGQCYPTQYRLKLHEKRHGLTVTKKYQCNRCEQRFVSIGKLRIHELRHDTIEGNVMGKKCEGCQREFANNKSLRRHMEICPLSSGFATKKYTCTICGRIFAQMYRLKRHEEIHNPSRSKICDGCNKTFASKASLDIHLNKGNCRGVPAPLPPKEFFCSECGKGFEKQFSLKIHMKVHSRTKRETCQDCGKTFADNYSLARHWKRGNCKKYLAVQDEVYSEHSTEILDAQSELMQALNTLS